MRPMTPQAQRAKLRSAPHGRGAIRAPSFEAVGPDSQGAPASSSPAANHRPAPHAPRVERRAEARLAEDGRGPGNQRRRDRAEGPRRDGVHDGREAVRLPARAEGQRAQPLRRPGDAAGRHRAGAVAVDRPPVAERQPSPRPHGRCPNPAALTSHDWQGTAFTPVRSSSGTPRRGRGCGAAGRPSATGGSPCRRRGVGSCRG